MLIISIYISSSLVGRTCKLSNGMHPNDFDDTFQFSCSAGVVFRIPMDMHGNKFKEKKGI